MNERKELIERLRDATEGPQMLMGEAADMLEADAQSIDVAYSQGFIEGERAAIVSQAVPQEPGAWRACIDEARKVYCDFLDVQEALHYLAQVFIAAEK